MEESRETVPLIFRLPSTMRRRERERTISLDVAFSEALYVFAGVCALVDRVSDRTIGSLVVTLIEEGVRLTPVGPFSS
jgi:hypothetical protein